MKYFVIFWSVAIAIVPGFIILAYLQYWWWSLILVLLALLARTNTIRIVVRTGAFGMAPTACSSAKILKMFEGLQPTIVGSAWGFFLQRRTAKTPILSMRNFIGRDTESSDCWAAGSTIKEVLDYYEVLNKTFPSHPSQDDITIGSWFATGSHGSGGDIGKSSSSVLHSAEVVCFNPPAILLLEHKDGDDGDVYKKLRDIFDNPNSNHVITWIKFHNFVKNNVIQKEAFDVNNVVNAGLWLGSGAILRVLFVGAARDGLGIRGVESYNLKAHTDPHCCSKCCTFFQADVCSACCGCKEDYTRWNGLTTLREANRWSPPIIPLETLIAVVCGYTNFELVFRVLDESGIDQMTASLLEKMVRKLREMHKEIGGRAEIRYGTGVVFWDMSLQRSFERPFQLLRDLGVRRVALHPGKAQPSVNAIPIVTIGDIYFNKRERQFIF